MYLILIPDLGRLGGAERISLGLAQYMREKGYACEIASLYPSPLVKEEFTFDISKGLIHSFAKATFAIKQNKITVVNAHLKKGVLFARLLKLLINFKILSSFHNSYQGKFFTSGLLLSASRKLDNMATNVTVAAFEYCVMKKYLVRTNSKVILNGIDTEKYNFCCKKYHRFRKILNIHRDELVLISVGHLCEQKGQDILISAMAGLVSNTKWRLIIIGEGHMESELEKLISANTHVAERIILVGNRKNVKLYYNICDAVIMPSRWEGFGLVAAEALACERRLLISQCDGLAEVFSDFAITAQPGDVLDLRQKIKEMLSELERATRPSQSINAREFVVQNLSNKKMYEAYEHAITRLGLE